MKMTFNAITDFNLEIDIDQLEDELYRSLVSSYEKENKTEFTTAKCQYEENIKFFKSCGICLNESRIKMKLKLMGVEI